MNDSRDIKVTDDETITKYTIYSRGEPLVTSSNREDMESAISNMDQHANLIRETITTTSDEGCSSTTTVTTVHSLENITPSHITKNKYNDY